MRGDLGASLRKGILSLVCMLCVWFVYGVCVWWVRSLIVSGCSMRGIPTVFVGLSSLVALNFAGNRLTGVPSVFSGLSSLQCVLPFLAIVGQGWGWM
jgi:hypothetical protein